MTEAEEFEFEALSALQGSGGDIADDGFSALVLRKIHTRRRRKTIVIGAVGSIGSAVAGAYSTAAVAAMEVTTNTSTPFLSALTPEAIAATGLAGVAAVVAWIVPGRA